MQRLSSQQSKDLLYSSESDEEEKQIETIQPEKHDKETIKFIQKQLLYKGHDPFPEKLVQRPEKDVIWGLGGELLKRKQGMIVVVSGGRCLTLTI